MVSGCPDIVNSFEEFSRVCKAVFIGSLLSHRKAFDKGLLVPENYLVHIAVSVVNGLDFLYSQLKVMHRDVKPSNILIDKDARVKVILCKFIRKREKGGALGYASL